MDTPSSRLRYEGQALLRGYVLHRTLSQKKGPVLRSFSEVGQNSAYRYEPYRFYENPLAAAGGFSRLEGRDETTLQNVVRTMKRNYARRVV